MVDTARYVPYNQLRSIHLLVACQMPMPVPHLLEPVQELKHARLWSSCQVGVVDVLQAKPDRCAGHPLEVIKDCPSPGTCDIDPIVEDRGKNVVEESLIVVLQCINQRRSMASIYPQTHRTPQVPLDICHLC
jgi:hypothetical protein